MLTTVSQTKKRRTGTDKVSLTDLTKGLAIEVDSCMVDRAIKNMKVQKVASL